jgi:hypothetical protein
MPNYCVRIGLDEFAGHTAGLLNKESVNVIFLSKHLVHERPNPVNILIPNLYEDRAAVGEQIAGDGQPVAQIGQAS